MAKYLKHGNFIITLEDVHNVFKGSPKVKENPSELYITYKTGKELCFCIPDKEECDRVFDQIAKDLEFN